MAEDTGDELGREFGSIIAGLELGETTRESAWRPVVRVERLKVGDTVPIGARARFLMTSYDDSAQLATYGWRTDLRIHAAGAPALPGLHEPGAYLVDERDWYTDSDPAGVWVDLSRVWVERLTVQQDAHDVMQSDWLGAVVQDPNSPVLEPLQPVPGRHHLTGARVVHDRGDGTLEHDLRAAAPVLLGDDGTLMVPVVTERHWYRWADHDYEHDFRPVRALPADRLWVE
ncbi:MAG: hypothetical protein L0H79_09000 [Intrasporangium sp.]|uniref:hypothetical protein n=1 Tax=Intrasporangium sp. TaxID=1925024 RepID=UPI002648B12E|nr:hypothetical protein [Intrasporangium sp.]MDN5795873.1 hypothetical protein [Intrasporangium sp.]